MKNWALWKMSIAYPWMIEEDRIKEDVSAMCNLSQGILERGEAKGETH